MPSTLSDLGDAWQQAILDAHMLAEAELSVESVEYREYLIGAQSRAVAGSDKADYYERLFALAERLKANDHAAPHGSAHGCGSRTDFVPMDLTHRAIPV